MKLIQVVRPLFLVAVALHGLALFVPLGADEPAVIEDLELSELAKPESAASKRELPVPDPNVSTGTTAAPNTGKTTPKPVVAGSPAAVANRSGARAASVAVRPATSSARPAPAQPPRAATVTPTVQVSPRPATSSSGSSTDADAGNASGNSETPPPPGSALPVLGEDGEPVAANSGDENGGDSVEGTTAGRSTNEVTVAALLQEVSQDLPESLKTAFNKLEEALTYDATDTAEESAGQLRAAWQEAVAQRASIGSLDQLSPTALASLTQVVYPMEASKQAPDYLPEYLAGRSLNICLEQEPHAAEIGVLVDAQGNVVDEPTLIRSTGYAALNEAIKAKVASSDGFPRDRSAKAYNFEVEVDYSADTCVSLGELKE